MLNSKENLIIQRKIKGIYFYSNGERYEGDFLNNEADGVGTYYYLVITFLMYLF